jgi:hypothetical protein
VPRKPPAPPAEHDDVEHEPNPFAEGLVSATQAELRKLDSLDTMLGQQVLIIARGMARGQGSELATLSKEHSRLMANIAAGNTVAEDPVADADEAVKRKLARATQA